MSNSGIDADEGIYTPQYKTITSTGHTRPTQEIGAPALIWHVAVWPHRDDDPQDAKPELRPIDVKKLLRRQTRPPLFRARSKAGDDPYEVAAQEHNRRRANLIGDPPTKGDTLRSLNDLLRRLQSLGRNKRSAERELIKLGELVERQHHVSSSGQPGVFHYAQPGGLGFTLWWRDPGTGGQRAMEKPGYDALRVRVQVEVEDDFFAITFLIDVGNPWNAGQVYRSAEAPGARRKRIFQYVEAVRESCEAELVKPGGGSLDKPLVPLDRVQPPATPIAEADLDRTIATLGEGIKTESVEAQETAVLLEASKYLYSEVWNELCRDFKFEFKDIAGQHGRVFANFRGLVMSSDGADDLRKESAGWSKPASPEEQRSTATPGRAEFRRFDGASPEPNAMVKAYWPFIRRMKPYADYREYVACGVFNWRALYITALGAQSEYDSADESTGRDYEVPSGNLPETSGWIRQPGGSAVADDPLLGANGEEPIRYLILTKCEPHRRQLGRIVDRINALGTMRLFALKSYSDIADASEHVRMRGQQLDQIMARWIEARKNIEVEFRTDPDNRNSALSALNEYVELQLIEIAAGLDRLGEVVVGGLPYRIARSRYFTRRFHQMRKQLIVGNIESWTSYDQFATRGLQPVFDFIESVGQRLRALRLRLANVMQSIQTSALVSQSEETRKNTRRLELLYASTNSLGIIGVWGVLALWVQHVEKAGKFILGFCARTDLTGLATLMCQVHARTFGETLEVAQEGYVVAGVIVTLLVSVFLALRQMLRWLGIVRFAAVAAIVLFVMAMAAWASPMLLPRSWADEITPLVRPLGWMATASAVLFAVGITLEALANLVSRLRRPAEGAIPDGI